MEQDNPRPVDTLPTPNPEALMFKAGVELVEKGSYEFDTATSAEDSPLPRRLFCLDGVSQVLVTSRFVTVTKQADYRWPELVPAIKSLIREHLDSGDLAVDQVEKVKSTAGDSSLATAIEELIDAQVRPAVAMDGGDIQFVGLTEDKMVQLRLIGACSSCPSSMTTLRIGIESLLLDEFPDLQGVEQVV